MPSTPVPPYAAPSAVVRLTVPLSATVLVPAVEPMVIAVVEPDAPFMPMLTVLVLPDAVTPVATLVVCDAVEEPSVIAPVPAVPPIVIRPDVCEVAVMLVVVPLNVTVLFAERVVCAPEAGVVAPIAMPFRPVEVNVPMLAALIATPMTFAVEL